MLADTNVVVALLSSGSMPDSLEARTLVESAVAEGERLVITEGVLVECVWVLISRFGHVPADVSRMVSELLVTPPFRLWNGRLALAALRLMAAEPRLDIVDCLLLERSIASGEPIATFDRLARRIGDELVEI